MASLRRTLATSSHPLVILLRKTYRGVMNLSLPVPVLVVRPLVMLYYAIDGVIRFIRRVFIAEPFFKAQCKSYGKNVHTSIFLHWMNGKGDIILGDDITIDGKSSFTFAARFSDHPTLEIGDGTDMSNRCSFFVGKRITIGKHCMIASGTIMFDSNGHSTDPASRLAGLPPPADEVKPITIGDNVWIGRNVMIFPGVTVGDGSVISAAAVVMSDVPPYTVVAGNPARRVSNLTPPAVAGEVSPAAAQA
jgi:acetyltransferase-like isoleucine patch superfamily enzyme